MTWTSSARNMLKLQQATVTYQDLGHFEQANEYQQRALDIELDKLGPEHVDVACSYNNLASIYQH